MKTVLPDFASFKAEADRRGLEVFNLPKNEEEIEFPVYAGIRQVNHNPAPGEPQYIFIYYGVACDAYIEDRHEIECIIFDADEEFEAWSQDEARKAFDSFFEIQKE
jgi:hypothetical protein